MRQTHFLLLFALATLSGCGAGQINTGPELAVFEVLAPSNTQTADGIDRVFVTALPPTNRFSLRWETKGNASQEHTFDFFIRNEPSVEDEDLGFIFRQDCGAEASVLSDCISVGETSCTFTSSLSVSCTGGKTGRTELRLTDLNVAFMIGRICYRDEQLDQSCTSITVAAELHP